MGTITISGAFAARSVLPDWWLLLILGLLEVPLGVLALANPGATLAAIVTVGGIWAVAVGVMRVVLSFEVKRLRRPWTRRSPKPPETGPPAQSDPIPDRVAPSAS